MASNQKYIDYDTVSISYFFLRTYQFFQENFIVFSNFIRHKKIDTLLIVRMYDNLILIGYCKSRGEAVST